MLRLVAWDMLHNCLAHPLRSLSCYSQLGIDFHAFTGRRVEQARLYVALAPRPGESVAKKTSRKIRRKNADSSQ